jgi:hypothetical protein
MTAPADIYQVASGQPIYGGRAAPVVAAGFDAEPSYIDTSSGAPPWTANLIQVFEVHGSGGADFGTGRRYTAPVSGLLALPQANTATAISVQDYDFHDHFGFSQCYSYNPSMLPGGKYMRLRPIDVWGNKADGTVQESAHCGFKLADGFVHLIAERRMDALLDWADKTFTQFDQTRRIITGGSMGGWGSASYGVRRYNRFCAVYPDRPRWKHNADYTALAVPTWGQGFVSTPYASAPQLAPEDGGGSFADHLNMIAYVSNPANKVRWIGWCLGRQDGFANFQDSIDMVAALRANKRGFAFAWNNGTHSTGSILSQITASYPFGTFQFGKGYPLFTEHSLDQDPNVDLVGMINGNLAFRNVVETATGWSCEVTSIAAACTVKVEPISDVFTKTVAKQLVSIPAANTWVLVQFS